MLWLSPRSLARPLGLMALASTSSASAAVHTVQPAVVAHGIDPRSICDRYSDETYETMRADRERTESYANAIRLAAPGRVCLDIGTGSLALLAVIAARAGAKHVYAIEANAEAASQARALVADEGLADVITIVEGYSTDVVLPDKVDLLLHEILGEVAGAEGVVAAVRDAAARHWTAPDGLNGPDAGATRSVASVPARALSLVGPAEFPSSEYFASLPFPMIAAPGSTIFKLPGLPRSTLLAPPAIFEDLDFEAAANTEAAVS